MLLLAACGGDDGPDRKENGVIIAPGEESVFNLAVGDCINPPTKLPDPDTPELQELTAVPCTDAHTHEVYAMPDFTTTDVYPGPSELKGFADGACLTEFEGYVGSAYEDSSLRFSYLLPSLRSWNEEEDRTVICLLVATEEKLTASAKGSKL